MKVEIRSKKKVIVTLDHEASTVRWKRISDNKVMDAYDAYGRKYYIDGLLEAAKAFTDPDVDEVIVRGKP